MTILPPSGKIGRHKNEQWNWKSAAVYTLSNGGERVTTAAPRTHNFRVRDRR